MSYNVKHFLEQCLYSVHAAIKDISAEIIVIDNASADGSVAYLRPLFPSVQFIESSENLGFARANNIALQHAAGRHILFLNPDTILPEGCVAGCIEFLRERSDAGAVGIRMIDGGGRFLPESKRGFPSPLTSFYKLSGLTSLFPHSKRFARYYMGHLPETENNVVDVLAGAFMMIKRTVLEKTGGFDEQFFMYAEDIDLSYRIQQAGYRNYYFAESTIIHFKGESTHRGSLNYVKLFYKAMLQFVRKHYSRGQSWRYRIVIEVGIWLRGLISAIGKLIPAATGMGATKKISTLIVGSASEADAVVQILEKYSADQRSTFAIGEIKELEKRLPAKPFDEIIFCVGKFSYEEIISSIDGGQYAMNALKFCRSGSGSIVGSNSKKEQGEVLS